MMDPIVGQDLNGSFQEMEGRFLDFCKQIINVQQMSVPKSNLFTKDVPNQPKKPVLRPSLVDRAFAKAKSALVSSTPMVYAFRNTAFTPETSGTVSPIRDVANGNISRSEKDIVLVASSHEKEENIATDLFQKKNEHVNNIAAKLALSAKSAEKSKNKEINTINKSVQTSREIVRKQARSMRLQTGGACLLHMRDSDSERSSGNSSSGVDMMLDRCDDGALSRLNVQSLLTDSSSDPEERELSEDRGLPWRVASGLGKDIPKCGSYASILNLDEDIDDDDTFLPKPPKKKKVFANRKKRKSLSRRKSARLRKIGQTVVDDNDGRKEASKKKIGRGTLIDVSVNTTNNDKNDNFNKKNETRVKVVNASLLTGTKSTKEKSLNNRKQEETLEPDESIKNQTEKRVISPKKSIRRDVGEKTQTRNQQLEANSKKKDPIVLLNNISIFDYQDLRNNQSFDSHERLRMSPRKQHQEINQASPSRQPQTSKSDTTSGKTDTSKRRWLNKKDNTTKNVMETRKQPQSQDDRMNQLQDINSSTQATEIKQGISPRRTRNSSRRRVDEETSSKQSEIPKNDVGVGKKTTQTPTNQIVTNSIRRARKHLQSIDGPTDLINESQNVIRPTAATENSPVSKEEGVSPKKPRRARNNSRRIVDDPTNLINESQNINAPNQTTENRTISKKEAVAGKKARTRNNSRHLVDDPNHSKIDIPIRDVNISIAEDVCNIDYTNPQEKIDDNPQENSQPFHTDTKSSETQESHPLADASKISQSVDGNNERNTANQKLVKRRAAYKKKKVTPTLIETPENGVCNDSQSLRRSTRQRRQAKIRSVGFVLCDSEFLYKQFKNASVNDCPVDVSTLKKKPTKRQTSYVATGSHLSPVIESVTEMPHESDNLAVSEKDTSAGTRLDFTLEQPKKNRVLSGRISKRTHSLGKKKLFTSVESEENTTNQMEGVCNLLNTQCKHAFKNPQYKPIKNLPGISYAVADDYPSGLLKIEKGKTKPKQVLTRNKVSFVVVRGQCEVGIGEETSVYKQWDMFLVPPGCEYYIKNLSKTTAALLAFTKMPKD